MYGSVPGASSVKGTNEAASNFLTLGKCTVGPAVLQEPFCLPGRLHSEASVYWSDEYLAGFGEFARLFKPSCAAKAE